MVNLSCAKRDCKYQRDRLTTCPHHITAACPQVSAEAAKISKEAEEADALMKQVQGELDKALPALQASGQAGLRGIVLF